MLTLLMAAALASSTPTTHIPIQSLHSLSQQQIQATADVCAAILMKKISVQEVVDNLKLDTVQKQQGLVNTCSIYFQGINDGMVIAATHNRVVEPSTLLENHR